VHKKNRRITKDHGFVELEPLKFKAHTDTVNLEEERADLSRDTPSN